MGVKEELCVVRKRAPRATHLDHLLRVFVRTGADQVVAYIPNLETLHGGKVLLESVRTPTLENRMQNRLACMVTNRTAIWPINSSALNTSCSRVHRMVCSLTSCNFQLIRKPCNFRVRCALTPSTTSCEAKSRNRS